MKARCIVLVLLFAVCCFLPALGGTVEVNADPGKGGKPVLSPDLLKRYKEHEQKKKETGYNTKAEREQMAFGIAAALGVAGVLSIVMYFLNGKNINANLNTYQALQNAKMRTRAIEQLKEAQKKQERMKTAPAAKATEQKVAMKPQKTPSQSLEIENERIAANRSSTYEEAPENKVDYFNAKNVSSFLAELHPAYFVVTGAVVALSGERVLRALFATRR